MKYTFLWTSYTMLVCGLSMNILSARTLEMPNPRKDYSLCNGSKRPKWICDPSRILRSSEVDQINRALEALRLNTTCACTNNHQCRSDGTGYTVTIAVKSFLPDRGLDTVTPFTYAQYLRRYEWTFGACTDDVVIVLDAEKKEAEMSVGMVAELTLNLLAHEDIIRDSKPLFESEDHAEGLLQIVKSLEQVFVGEYRRTPPFPVWTVVHMGLGASFVLCCFFSMYACKLLYSQ